MNGKTFKDFIQNGVEGFFPTEEDFFLHLKSIWTEVRIKKYMEFRSFDSVPASLIPSAAAVIKGLTLDSDVMDAVNNIIGKSSFNEYCELRDDVNKFALQAEFQGKKVLDFAKELLELASINLKNHPLNDLLDQENESQFLLPIENYVFKKEQSPAKFVMNMWQGSWNRNPHKLVDWLEK